MPQNYIKHVELIRREIAKGMPDGLTEDFLRKLPDLFTRIEELERALVPFARAFKNNEQFNDTMLRVYKENCKEAFYVLDSANAVQPPKKYEYPA